MNRIVFILLLLVPFFLLGYFFPQDFPQKILPVLIIFYIPILVIIRMKFIKMSWKEMLLSLIPFYGIRYQFKIFTKKNKSD